ncbi:MAG: methylmalonyl-CoA mutase family protein [Cyanobacteriota bacterium]|mgnify:CR=1 FL=1
MKKEQWIKENQKPERKDGNFKTLSEKEIDVVYTPEDIENTSFEDEIGNPGEYPYTRGIHTNMHRGKLWTMRQFAGFGTPEETNKRFKYLLEQGQTGLSTAFDMPTLMGYDSDHVMSEGEVGKEGVAVSSIEDMEILFKDIPLDKVSTSMTINGPACVLLALYVAVAEKQGVDPKQLRGTLQADILKEYIAQKEWLFPPRPSMKVMTDMMEFCKDNLPNFNSISISGYHIREAGSTAVQELAFTLADGFAYVEAGMKVGMDVDDFAPRLSFFFNCHNDFFEEIAKFRAARRIWAKRLKEKYGAKNPKSWMLRFHTQTAGCSLTAQQPENNIVRTAIQALAGVIGGTQSLHTNSMDEALALPTEKSVRIALRTQQIIACETGVTHTADPLGGSYYVEHLTNVMEEEANKYFDKIDDYGGVIPAIEDSFFQKEIMEASYNFQKDVEKNKRLIVGVNCYTEGNEDNTMEILKVDHSFESKQVERLKKFKEIRDNKLVEDVLKEIKDTAEKNQNIMYPILKAVKLNATLGEICDTLKVVYGGYREKAVF